MVSAEDINYRYYKAMRFGVHRKRLDEIRYVSKTDPHVVNCFDMLNWIDQGPDSLDGMQRDARGQYHDVCLRWSSYLQQNGFKYILKGTKITRWLEHGLRAPSLYQSLHLIEHEPANVAPYLMLMRWLQLLEMHANGFLGDLYHLDRWVNIDDGYGPCSKHQSELPMYGATQLNGMVACSFALKNVPVTVTVPFSEISDRDTQFVLVFTKDLEAFMPVVNKRLLAQ